MSDAPNNQKPEPIRMTGVIVRRALQPGYRLVKTRRPDKEATPMPRSGKPSNGSTGTHP